MDLLACARNKLHDPIVMSWALTRYRHADLSGSDTCCEMERLWFHDLILSRWLDSDDHDVLANMFRTLPTRLFANLRPAILSRWMGWSGLVGAAATPVLAECPLDEVVSLFDRHVEGCAHDLDKTFAVLSRLCDLPSPAAQQLLDKAMLRLDQADDDDFGKAILAETLLKPAFLYNEKHFWELTAICARTLPESKVRAPLTLRAIFSALAGSGMLMTLADRSFTDADDVSYSSLAPLFRPDAPLEDCDHLVREGNPWPRAKALLEAHGGASAAAVAKAAAVCRLFEEQTKIDPSALATFAIASTLHAFEFDRIVADSLSLEQTLDLLSLDIPECRHFEQLAQRLGDFEREAVAQAICDRLPALTEKWSSLHLAKMAGHLRLKSTAAALLDCLTNETGDYLCEAATDALVRLGETAVSIVAERWDGLDNSQKIYGRSVLERIGGEAASQFALDRFEELFHDDHQEWCSLMEACPDVRAIGLIEPHLKRKQPAIDKCYSLLCTLTGEEPAGLEGIRDRVLLRRRQELDHRANLDAGGLGELFNTLTLTLRCEKCGDVNRYDLNSVVVGESSTAKAFVGDDLRCASCAQWADFEFTAESYMQMMAALLVYHARKDAGSDDADSQKLFQFIDVHYRWQTRSAPEVMAELKAAAKEHPEHIVNHLRLGRMQYLFKRRGRAEECYQNALRLEPQSMEAGLGLAQILSDAGKKGEAFESLCRMLDAKSDWRFFRTDELSPKSLSDEFVRFFNKLHATLRVRDRPLLHAAAVEGRRKIGRNDPCPCGSGAKYKKCCGASQSAQLR